jgi:hypothetical protein
MTKATYAPVELPNRATLVGRWILAAVSLTFFGGLGVICAAVGEWGVATFVFAFVLMCLLFWWAHVTERLTLDRKGFVYRLGSKSWRCEWDQCASFEAREATAHGLASIVIRWKKKGPGFSPLRNFELEESKFHSSLGLRAKKLAAMMSDLRTRAEGPVRKT